jgi:hypothetical protein
MMWILSIKSGGSEMLSRIVLMAVSGTAALGAILSLASCSGGMEGTYISTGGIAEVEIVFKSNGKAEMTSGFGGVKGQTMELDYKLEDNKVKLGPIIGGATMIMAVDKDGCIDGGAGLGKLCKKKN